MSVNVAGVVNVNKVTTLVYDNARDNPLRGPVQVCLPKNCLIRDEGFYGLLYNAPSGSNILSATVGGICAMVDSMLENNHPICDWFPELPQDMERFRTIAASRDFAAAVEHLSEARIKFIGTRICTAMLKVDGKLWVMRDLWRVIDAESEEEANAMYAQLEDGNSLAVITTKKVPAGQRLRMYHL